MELFSPAKLNLTLQITEKRRDGYHEIRTLMQAIDLGDTLSLSISDQDELTCSDPALPMDARNLVVRALRLFRLKTGNTVPIRCHLTKRIPAEAGLGGGSSNCATMLYGLSTLLGRYEKLRVLAEWAGELGSDTPFFFSEGRALCTGRGEKTQSIPGEELECWVAKPASSLSTAAVYGALEVNREKTRVGPYFNDLEAAALSLLPELKEAKQALLSLGFSSVHMTGSGTAFFCLGNPKTPFLPGAALHKVRFINRSPGSWYKFQGSSMMHPYER